VAALIIYQNAQINGRGEGFDQLLDELSRRFARKTRKPVASDTKP
jgi:phosphopantothenate synthetase